MPRQHRILLAAVLVAGAGAIAVPALSGAKGEQPQPASPTPLYTIVALGTGDARVKARSEDGQERIARSVRAAHGRAVPQAIASAREEAILLARAADLILGPIVSVDETRQSPAFYYYAPGRFGPGRYCGTTSRRIRTSSGRRKTVKRHRCFAPEREVATLAVTFALG